MPLPILEKEVIACPPKFDSSPDGELLLARLKLHNIPCADRPGLFSSGLPCGKQWSVEFFTESGSYAHDGGWCWHKDNFVTWASEVNEDIFRKRLELYPARVRYKEAPPKEFLDRHYIHLIDGTNAKIGDVVMVSILIDDWRSRREEVPGVIAAVDHGRGWWNVDIYANSYDVFSEPEHVHLGQVFSNAKLLPHNPGYFSLHKDYARKYFRNFHGLRGSLKKDFTIPSKPKPHEQTLFNS